MAFQINGPNGGNGIIFGNTFPNDDIINAFDFNNLIFSEGANDQINTGSGSATVNLGNFVGVTDTVNVGGAFNTVATSGSQLASTLTVQGGTGNNLVNLANTLGNNNVAMQGYNNVITVNGDANNVLLSGAGRGTVHAGVIGDGNTGFHTTVDAAGQNNTVIGGDQNFFISGGQGVDFISVGNGDNTIFEAGAKDKITVGTGGNTITDFGGFATITFNGFVEDVDDIDIVNIGGTNNTVTETLAASHSERDFTITGGTGNGKFTLGDGANVLTTSGSNNVVKMGSTEAPVIGEEIGEASGDAVTITGGVNNSVTLGDGNNVVKVDGVASTITLGNGANSVTANGNDDVIGVGNGANTIQANGTEDAITAGNGGNTIAANGDDDVITAGNGNNTITANGKEDIITLGNGNNTLTSNGNVDVITIGNGNNKVTAQGNGDTITLGTGNNTVDATGSNNDTITSAGGKGSFIIGGETSLTLTASSAGTTVDAQGALDSITLNNNANAAINDSPFGGGLSLTINATGGANAGVIKLTGFESDVTGLIDLHGFAGITSTAGLLAASGSDGSGGTLIHLGTGSLDLVGSTINNASFSFA
jgi:hypothetical protein